MVLYQGIHVIIREFQPPDTAAAALAMSESHDYLVVRPEAVTWRVHNMPAEQRYRLLVSEVDGQVTGIARTGLVFESSEPGLAFANISVLPAQRGHGAG